MDTNAGGCLNEMKQSFLASAIADIATYIQLADTKVSIIMGALVALIAGTMACYEPIADIISRVKPCSWIGICLATLFRWMIKISLKIWRQNYTN